MQQKYFWPVFLREIERGREKCEWGRSEEKGRQRILSTLHTQCGAPWGAQFHDCKIMTWAKIKSWWLNRLSHPGTSLCPICDSSFHLLVMCFQKVIYNVYLLELIFFKNFCFLDFAEFFLPRSNQDIHVPISGYKVLLLKSLIHLELIFQFSVEV